MDREIKEGELFSLIATTLEQGMLDFWTLQKKKKFSNMTQPELTQFNPT